MKRKPVIVIMLVFLLSAIGQTALRGGTDNAYDLLSRAFVPLLNPLMENPDPAKRGLRMVIVVEGSMKGRKEANLTRRIVVTVEAPDKLRIDTLLHGQRIILCRNGEEVWAWPGDLVKPLIPGNLKSSKRKLGPFRLPVNDAAIVFLPALLSVKDQGSQMVGDQEARVMDIQLSSELARKTGTEDMRVRTWISPTTFAPLRMEGEFAGWRGALIFESVQYFDTLPAPVWEPSEKEKADVLRVSGSEFLALVSLIQSGLPSKIPVPQE